MKKFLLATILITATTATFGAASLRTQKVASGATATPITAPGRARAGTLRSQPTKMISSTPKAISSATTTTTPSATQNSTNARLSFIKPPKNLTSISDINKTSEVNQQFANIDSRIDNIEENIGDIVSTQTYTKSEIDEMLRAITPTIDDNGYLNMTLADGTSVRQSPYWLIGIVTGAGNTVPHVYTVYAYGYNGNYDSSFIGLNWVQNEICSQTHTDDTLGCCLTCINGGNYGCIFGDQYSGNSFFVNYQYNGYDVLNTGITYQNDGKIVREQIVYTAVDNAESYIQNEICGTSPATECWVEFNHSYYPGGDQAPEYSGCAMVYAFDVYTVIGEIYHLVNSGWFHGDLEYNEYYDVRPGSVNHIDSEWVNMICANYHSPSDFIRCYKSGSPSYDNNHNIVGFTVRKDYPGFYLDSAEATDNGVKYNYITHQEELTESDLREHFCGDRPASSCWISNYRSSLEANTFWYREFSVNIIDTNTLFGYFMTGFDDSEISKITHYTTTSHPSSAIIQSWVNYICEATPTEQSTNMLGCCWLERSENGSDSTYFGVHRMFHGYEVISSETTSQPTVLNHQHVMFNTKLVRTFENNSQSYIQRELCGTRPVDECHVEYESSIDTCDNRITEHRYYVYSRITPPASYESTGVDTDEISTVTHYISGLNPTNSAIQTWVNNICAATPASQATNMLGCCWEQCESGDNDPTCFDVRRMYPGYKIVSSKIVTRNNQLVLDQEIETYEDDAETNLLYEFCDGRPSSECWVYHVTGDEIATCDSGIKRHTHHVQSVFEYYLHNVGEEPTIDGLGRKITIRTNAPDNMLKLYSDYWCANRGDFWCKTFIEDIPQSTDRLFIIRIRHHGVKCSTDHMSTVGTYMQCATNENNTNESYTLDYVNSKICGASAGTDACYVTRITDTFNGHPENFENNQEPITRYDVSVFKKMIEEEKLPLRLKK